MVIRQKNYKLRLITVLIVFFLLFLIIGVRLYLVQIHKQNFFKNLAAQQYSAEVTVLPSRALIYDRNGKQLTINTEAQSAFILPQQLKDKKTKKILKKHYKQAYKRLKKNPATKFLWLARKLSKDEKKKITKYKSEDIHFIEEPARHYPYRYLSPLLGFTDIDNNGLAGIELQYNEQLNGTSTKYLIEKDARPGTFYFEKSIKKLGAQGEPVKLTIDNTLQFLAYDELKKTIKEYEALSGAAVVMNPDTGEILAMASYPSFNPNKKNLNDPAKTKNISITECYEPGSIIKAFSTLSAFEEKVVEYDEEIDCEGKIAFIDGFRVENWKSIDVCPFWEVVQRSSNVGMAKVAKRLGTKFYDHLKQLGFGNKTGIEFPGERDGFVNHPINWSRPTLLVLSFGYEINGTVLQLAKAFSVIANGGYDVKPTLLKKNAAKKLTKKLYNDESIKLTKNVLETIGQKRQIPNYRVMGKTGTARCVKDGKYTNKEHVYFYGGIVEKDDYKRVVVVFVNRPKKSYLYAHQVTGPLFKRIAEKVIIRETV